MNGDTCRIYLRTVFRHFTAEPGQRRSTRPPSSTTMTTSIAVESAVRSYLRVSDVLNCVLEGRAIQHGPNEESSAVVDQEDNPSAGRVLAIVTSNAAENAEGRYLNYKCHFKSYIL